MVRFLPWDHGSSSQHLMAWERPALPPDLQGENLAERMLALSQAWSPSVLFPSPTVRAISWVLRPLIFCIPSCGCPSLKYVTLEQLRVVWGTPPMPPSPSPGLPSWASASQDLAPITCLPPMLPSSFASITRSSKVGGLCVLPTPPPTPVPLLLGLCVALLTALHVLSQLRAVSDACRCWLCGC